MSKSRQPVFMVGHSTRKLGEFIKMLRAYGIEELVDIRAIPRSRANPQFNEKRLASALKRHHISYKYMKGLGGFRRPSKDSTNTYWRNASFRGFADYMQTSEFRKNIAELVGLAKKRQTAIMCAEALPWRCHRSLIADALLVRGVKVRHILSPADSRQHELTKSARVSRLKITYK